MGTATFKVSDRGNCKLDTNPKMAFNEKPTYDTDAVYKVTNVKWTEWFSSDQYGNHKFTWYFYGSSNSEELQGTHNIDSVHDQTPDKISENHDVDWAEAVLTGVTGIHCASNRPDYCYWRGSSNQPITVTFTYSEYSKPSAPTSVSIAVSGNSDNKLKISWSGATGGGTGQAAIDYYDVAYNTTATAANAATLTASPRTTDAVAMGTWYAGVRSHGNHSAGYSSYKWSSGFTVSACGAPTSASASYANGVMTVTWSGASAGTHNAITGYGVGYSTTSGGTVSGEKTVTTTATSGSTTFTGLSSNTTYYFAIRTKGGFGSNGWSGYKWTAGVKYTHPSVAVGDPIEKSQMDILRTFKGNSPTAVTQYAEITATVGSTYKAASAGSEITAAWYNGA